MKWNIDRYKIPTSEDAVKIENISVIEHPHGGIIAVFSYISNVKTVKPIHYTGTLYFNEKNNTWNPQGNPLEFHPSSENFSHTTFLNLMGNLQMMYVSDCRLLYNISYDYGKNWKEIEILLEESVMWKMNNHPIFMKHGRVVIPVYDEGSGRSFAYISDDTGKNWFPSVFIEPSEDLTENSDPEEIFACRMGSPTFIQAGERKLVCFIQPENRDKLLCSVSDDFGETWSNAFETDIPSGVGGIESIRLRDSNGHYTPTVVLVYNQEKTNGQFSVMLAISSDIGESWDEIIELGEIEIPFTDISVIQTDDNKLHIIYCSKQEMNHLVVNDFVIF
ncbi:MAG: hypothetical protein EU530_10715 [Promethearchaeota archaeon]|nr:MAG: hypothetical protein EU530_10715 [Candidatus Lokiarchaeota archaeon]